jgi:hypothetical protein
VKSGNASRELPSSATAVVRLCRGARRRRAVLQLALGLASACGDPVVLPADAAGTLLDARTDDAAPADANLDACVALPFTGADRDIDILFVVATTASMATIDEDASQTSRWVAATQAIRAFVASLGGQRFGAGMIFFPLLIPGGDAGMPVEACAASEYLVPVVPIAALETTGAHAQAFEAALDARALEGGNAMEGALAGALRQAARAKASAGHIVHTVLVTDGTPDPCGPEVTGAAAAAGDAFRTDHLETYVLGVGPGATNLDPIAVAGGTFHAYSALADEGILSAFATIGATMRRCHFFFPMVLPDNQLFRVVMAIDDDMGGRQLLPRIEDGTDCRQNPGWFFNSPMAPAYAKLCPAACDAVLQHADRKVMAQIGCL